MYKILEIGPLVSFNQDTNFYINEEKISEINFDIVNVEPGEIKEIYEYLFIVPKDASKMITFDKDGKRFIMFASSDNKQVNSVVWSVTEDIENWMRIE